jgi:hypothetical protein
MNPKANKILFCILLTLSFITVVYIYISSDAPYDTGDGITHYLIARYSWIHPHQFLNMWGKPFFTLISSPFAQFGLKGIYVFQALNAAIISWLLFSISNKINLKNTWIIPAFIFFAPIYFAVMNSGLVEIFFGTIFIVTIWMVFNKHYYASAFVASLIPFVRPEAYVVMPLLILVYIYRKKLPAIPVMLSGTIIYSVAGYNHYKDIFWIITNNYKLVGDNYGSKRFSYFRYFGLYDEIWGTLYTILLLIGIGVICYQFFRLLQKDPKHEFVVEVFLLFVGSTIGFFVLHSLLCGMPGILNNLGMKRYLAVLIPGSAFIALISINLLSIEFFEKLRYLRMFLILSILTLVVYSAFSQWFYPFKQYNEGIVMKQVGRYIKTSWPDLKKICYAHPLIPVVSDIDPFDGSKVDVLWSAEFDKINNLPDSSLLIWDSHFMKGECNIPINFLIESPKFVLLKHYRFAIPDLPFEVYVFLKAKKDTLGRDSIPVELVGEKGLVSTNQISDSLIFTLANNPADFKPWLERRIPFSGKSAIAFKSGDEFGPVFSKKVSEIAKNGSINSVRLSAGIYQPDSLVKMIAVIEIKDGDKQLSWEGLVYKNGITPNQWDIINYQYTFLQPITNMDASVNIYLWNKDKQIFYIDDFKIVFNTGSN